AKHGPDAISGALSALVGRNYAPPRRDTGERRQRQLHHRQIAELRPEQLHHQLRILAVQRLQGERDLTRILQSLLHQARGGQVAVTGARLQKLGEREPLRAREVFEGFTRHLQERDRMESARQPLELDRKSTRLNSSHVAISYAVFCL